MKVHKHAQVCNMSSNRVHYTTHGFHMNAKGKQWLANLWASIIKTLPVSSQTSAIPVLGLDKCVDDSQGLLSPNEVTSMQPIISNITTSNEPLRNVRASWNKKTLDKDEDFLWY